MPKTKLEPWSSGTEQGVSLNERIALRGECAGMWASNALYSLDLWGFLSLARHRRIRSAAVMGVSPAKGRPLFVTLFVTSQLFVTGIFVTGGFVTGHG
jgi:hypothetical protein